MDAKDYKPIRKYKKAESLEFKRPDHPDFMDSAELKKKEFSGVRVNKLSNEWEIWTVGDLRARGPVKNQEAFMQAYQEVFQIENIAFITKAYEGILH